MTIRIVTDSTCDLETDTARHAGIEIVPLYVNVGNRGYLDGVELSRQAFYEQLPHYLVHPTTAAPGIEAFRGVYGGWPLRVPRPLCRCMWRAASARSWTSRGWPLCALVSAPPHLAFGAVALARKDGAHLGGRTRAA